MHDSLECISVHSVMISLIPPSRSKGFKRQLVDASIVGSHTTLAKDFFSSVLESVLGSGNLRHAAGAILFQ